MPVAAAQSSAAAVESEPAPVESQAAGAPATSLFPLREVAAEGPAAGSGEASHAWPVVPDSKSRNLTFEQLIRDIAIDEQRMNL